LKVATSTHGDARGPIRVAWVGGEPTPTRVPHLQALARRPEIELSVVYAAHTYQQRTWSVEHPEARFLRGPRLPTDRILHLEYPITPGIWPFLERGSFDVVVIAGWAVFAAQAAILWCRLRGRPYLLNAENHLLETRPPLVRAIKRLVLPRLVPQAAGMLVSGSLAREHAIFYGARPDRTIVFPNTPDVPKLAEQADRLRDRRAEIRSDLGIDGDEVVVLQVGRLLPVKGADVLVAAVGEAARRSRARIRMMLVGAGPEHDELVSLAKREGVSLTLTGEVEGEALISTFVAADIFALLSRRETWGIVVNEAMACGLPLVLSAAVGAAGDLLESGRNGFLVPPDDVHAAGTAIAELAGDAGRREEFGRRSRELIGSWGFEASLDEFCDLARKVVN
jgi:glycosyltransferase involved in cell wall biosynthesis